MKTDTSGGYVIGLVKFVTYNNAVIDTGLETQYNAKFCIIHI